MGPRRGVLHQRANRAGPDGPIQIGQQPAATGERAQQPIDADDGRGDGMVAPVGDGDQRRDDRLSWSVGAVFVRELPFPGEPVVELEDGLRLDLAKQRLRRLDLGIRLVARFTGDIDGERLRDPQRLVVSGLADLGPPVAGLEPHRHGERDAAQVDPASAAGEKVAELGPGRLGERGTVRIDVNIEAGRFQTLQLRGIEERDIETPQRLSKRRLGDRRTIERGEAGLAEHRDPRIGGGSRRRPGHEHRSQ